jgi:hypothetical protein
MEKATHFVLWPSVARTTSFGGGGGIVFVAQLFKIRNDRYLSAPID